jgi:hypothetical protein
MAIDITSRTHSLSRNTTVLYQRMPRPGESDPPGYFGVLRLEDGRFFWVAAWERTVNNRPVIEIQLTKKV